MKAVFEDKKKKLMPLYAVMNKVGKRHGISIPQVAMAFCSSKGIVPICGCRKPYQVEELHEAANVKLTRKEIEVLEKEADQLDVKILGADMFRMMVH